MLVVRTRKFAIIIFILLLLLLTYINTIFFIIKTVIIINTDTIINGYLENRDIQD